MRWTRVIIGFCLAFSVGATPSLAALTQEPSANTKSAVVMIAIFDKTGQFTGWGSGFYVDERIVVTNKHVINDGQYYRVYGTGSNNSVDLTCFRNLTRSDVKINLDDDVAYIRATLPCDHGTLFFAKNDPQTGDNIGILGYPFKGSLTESLKQTQTTGTVLGVDGTGSWLRTSAFVDFGNSGGPVLKNDLVVGVVVAKSVDSSGNFIHGLFIPESQIQRGLTYANNSTFGYTPQDEQTNSAYQTPVRTGPMSDSDCSLLLGEGGRAADNGDCKCITGFQRDASGLACVRTGAASSFSSSSSISSIRSSSSSYSSLSSRAPSLTPVQMRTCARVKKEFTGSAFVRVNARLMKRLGFGC